MDEWPKNPYVNVLVEWQCSFTVMLSWDTAQGRKIHLALLFQRFQFIVIWITWVWTWHETKHPGREHEVQQSCLPCNEQQAVGVRQDQEQGYPLQSQVSCNLLPPSRIHRFSIYHLPKMSLNSEHISGLTHGLCWCSNDQITL